MEKYVAFLRGINVGGHHKIPMAELRFEFEKMNFENTDTILNSGNVIFESDENISDEKISQHLEEAFGFPVPTLTSTLDTIIALFNNNPFEDINITKDIRLYVSFLKNAVDADLNLPWESADKSYKIIGKRENMIFSVVDISNGQTTKAMAALESFYGKELTTRNWNTIERIIKKAGAKQLK